MTRIVLNSTAESGFFHHLDIKICPFCDALCFEKFIFTFKILHPFLELRFNAVTCRVHFLLRNHIMRCRENCNMLQKTFNLPCQNIYLGNPVNLIAKKLHAHCRIGIVCRKNFQNISMHPESTALEIHLITRILHIDQSLDHIVPVNLHTRAQGNHHIHIVIRTTNSINTGYRCDNDNIFSLRQSSRRRKTQLVNLIINRRILCYIGVRLWHICLRLVIIVIGYKIFYRIFRKKFFHLAIQLSRKCFVMGNNQRRFVQCLNYIRHRKCLTGTGNAKQCLKLIALFKTFY